MSDKEFVSACNCKGKCRCVREPIRTPEQRKQSFREWLEKEATANAGWLEEDFLRVVLDKAKEML